MKICPIAIAVGCPACPAFKVCPAKASLGGYAPKEEPPRAAPRPARKPSTKAAKPVGKPVRKRSKR